MLLAFSPPCAPITEGTSPLAPSHTLPPSPPSSAPNGPPSSPYLSPPWCGPEPKPTCASGSEPCVYDEQCLDPSSDAQGGLGCNAGGKGQACRFCGFGDFVACGEHYSAQVSVGVALSDYCPSACTGNSAETCYFDADCLSVGGLGCNAGGQGQACRFCGFGNFVACPVEDPSVSLATGGLTQVVESHLGSQVSTYSGVTVSRSGCLNLVAPANAAAQVRLALQGLFCTTPSAARRCDVDVSAGTACADADGGRRQLGPAAAFLVDAEKVAEDLAASGARRRLSDPSTFSATITHTLATTTADGVSQPSTGLTASDALMNNASALERALAAAMPEEEPGVAVVPQPDGGAQEGGLSLLVAATVVRLTQAQLSDSELEADSSTYGPELGGSLATLVSDTLGVPLASLTIVPTSVVQIRPEGLDNESPSPPSPSTPLIRAPPAAASSPSAAPVAIDATTTGANNLLAANLSDTTSSLRADRADGFSLTGIEFAVPAAIVGVLLCCLVWCLVWWRTKLRRQKVEGALVVHEYDAFDRLDHLEGVPCSSSSNAPGARCLLMPPREPAAGERRAGAGHLGEASQSSYAPFDGSSSDGSRALVLGGEGNERQPSASARHRASAATPSLRTLATERLCDDATSSGGSSAAAFMAAAATTDQQIERSAKTKRLRAAKGKARAHFEVPPDDLDRAARAQLNRSQSARLQATARSAKVREESAPLPASTKRGKTSASLLGASRSRRVELEPGDPGGSHCLFYSTEL